MIIYFIQQQKDSLLVEQSIKTLETISDKSNDIISYWFWIALFEFFIILLFLFNRRKRNKNLEFSGVSKKDIMEDKNKKIDMGNLMNSINGSKDLYKKLSRACHPDRFINSDKQKIAEKIFQQITKNKRDFKKLEEIKELVKKELNITIN